MSLYKMTIMGIETYLQSHNDSLFQKVTVPAGIDLDILKNEILLKCAEFEVFYSDAYYMKSVTEHFFKKHYDTFEKWVEGVSARWNPIENYDRYEDYSGGRSENHTGNRSDDSTASDTTTASGSGSTDTSVTTYDSATYQPDGRTVSGSTSGSTSSTTGHNESETAEYTTGTDQHTSHIHGNIGVTQASDMVASFMDIAMWNIYEHIADLYKNEMTVGVYV